ncbi:hypothetical protein MAUB1S_06067 [Mycolicibacterium aubagnense]
MKPWMTQALDFFDWWSEEIRDLVSRNKPRMPDRAPDWTVDLAEDGIRIHGRDEAEFQSLPLDLKASAREIAEKLGIPSAKARSCDIRLDGAICLKRSLAPYRLPRRQARAMAALDVMATTPIDIAQVHLFFATPAGSDSTYYLVKKGTLGPVVEAVATHGISIRTIRIGGREAAVPIDRLSMAEVAEPGAVGEVLRKTVLTMACLTAVVVLATYGHVQWRYWQASSELDEKIASVETEARAARTMLRQRQTQLDQVEKIRKEKSGSVSVVKLLAEVTHVLPDSAWVTDFSSKGNTLTITGYAASASELIAPLEASPLLTSPEFSAPVTKVPGQSGERFTISATTGDV